MSAGEFKTRALSLFTAGHRVVPIPRGRKGPTLTDWPALAEEQTENSVRELIAKANGCGVGITASWGGSRVNLRSPRRSATPCATGRG